MVARSRMGGPWSRAQRVARAFQDAGHEAVLAWGDDGNCVNPVAPTLEIPVPSPLGLPEAIARHTFPWPRASDSWAASLCIASRRSSG